MKILLVSILMSLLLLSAQAQVTRFVSTTGTNPVPANATTWASSTTDLQGAINASAAGDQVWVAAEMYKPGGNANTSRSVSFAMKAEVAIYGGFRGISSETNLTARPTINPVSGKPSSTTLSGDIGTPNDNADNSYHVISNPQGLTTTAILDGFVITGGNANEHGGGMYNNGSGSEQVCSPLIRNCTFANSASNGNGGAMFNDGHDDGKSNPLLTNCAFQNNTATNSGGAIYNDGQYGTSNPSLTNCAFQNNTAYLGGAMFNWGRFRGKSSPSLTNCTFQNNTAEYGGVMFNLGASLGNSSPSLTNCSFQNNTATDGGVMYSDGYFGNSSTYLTNCVLFGNGSGNVFANSAFTATYSLFDNPTNVDITGPGNLTTATSPFVSSVSVALAPGSPAIDAGLSSATGLAGITTDLVGNARIVGCRVDMGAVEEQIFTKVPTVVITLPNGSTVNVAGNLPTITLPPNGPLVLQASGGSFYERVIILDRVNGFEIRQVDSNTTGIFSINRPGLFALTVTGAGGCSRTVQAVVQEQ